jgi:hypothetical protein
MGEEMKKGPDSWLSIAFWGSKTVNLANVERMHIGNGSKIPEIPYLSIDASGRARYLQ